MKNFISLIFILLGIAQQYVNGQQLPTVVTKKIYNIAPEGAYVNSEVTSDGGAFVSERGIWWDWQPDYTKSTSQLRKMRSDSGKGSYTSRIIFATGQQGGYTVYVRAYATNTKGTVYGNEIRFVIPNKVAIGTQVWLKENLNTAYFRNGDSITTGVYRTGTAGNSLGALYTWPVATDTRGLCPTGWHVPSRTDFDNLVNFLGVNPGGKLKSTSTLWTSPNVDATNASGFSALPGGNYISTTGISNVGNSSWMWSTSTYSLKTSTEALAFLLSLQNSHGQATVGYSVQSAYNSVRCIKD